MSVLWSKNEGGFLVTLTLECRGRVPSRHTRAWEGIGSGAFIEDGQFMSSSVGRCVPIHSVNCGLGMTETDEGKLPPTKEQCIKKHLTRHGKKIGTLKITQ